MKFNILFSVLLIVGLLGCDKKGSVGASSSATPGNDTEKTIYTMGILLGKRAQNLGLNATEKSMLQAGFIDSIEGKDPKIKVQEFSSKIGKFVRERATKISSKKAKTEKDAAKPFLAKMEKEAGAKKTKSGLIYIAQKEGTGDFPKLSDRVKVHYHGTLMNGDVFDSSKKRGKPAEFPLSGVIKCWQEGLRLMKVGGTAKIVCPSDIAYGDRGAPPKINPGATLVFDVELLEIKKTAKK